MNIGNYVRQTQGHSAFIPAPLIKEVHKELMEDARSTHFSDPGNFRRTQNWIGGAKLTEAMFVPPPVHEMNHAMGDLEKFFHLEDDILPIIKAGIIHAHFEIIHPFLDGNGRTGYLLWRIFFTTLSRLYF